MFYYLYKKYRQRQKAPTTSNESEPPGNATSKDEKQKKEKQCQHVKESPNGKCEICAVEKSAARKYRWKLLLLLLPGFFVASLDLTIVATALPFIASHFGMFAEFSCISQC
jgi:hypothetical protein